MYNKNIKEVFSELNSSENGLSSNEVKIRLEKYGFNELREKKKNVLKIFFSQFNNFMIYLLIFAAIIATIIPVYENGKELQIKDFLDAFVILGVLVLNAVLGFIQEYKADKSIRALKRMASLKARVLRDNKEIQIETRKLVPGDIILLEDGDKIPADCRLIEVINLETQEAVLTGESIPVSKDIKKLNDKLEISDQKNMVFMNTIVSKGRGKAVVINTGMNTEVGKIAKLIESIESDTPLQRNLSSFSKKIGFGIVLICIFIFGIGIFMRNDGWLNMFMIAVSLAVAAMPTALPAVVTVSLALGVQRMANKNALVRGLPSVETLGETSVICTDKTGTLTKNEMTVKNIFVNNKIISVSGSGYSLDGKFDDTKNIDLLLEIGALCNDAKDHIGDPTEIALLVSARKMGIKKSIIEKEYPRLGEVPFDSSRKMMSTLHKIKNKSTFYTKGATEIILKRCKKIWVDGRVKNLMPRDIKNIQETNESFAKNGMRVLAFAYGDSENNLTFVGLQAMIDPPREEVISSIKKCKAAGIKVVMITGDHRLTAESIAKQLGIEGEIIEGEELRKIKDLSKIVEKIGVYARVNPEDKLKIVSALKKHKHVVAMTGDGVNDAPALKEADIGIAIGSGTDVAKEASDMILVDDNFTSIVNAVEEGRGIYDNIKKEVFYLLSTNSAEVLIILFGILLNLPLPLLALQILWVNLITDGLPAMALGVNPKENNLMERKPRNPKEGILYNMIKKLAVIFSFITLGTLLVFYNYIDNVDYARTMTFMTLIMFECFNAINLSTTKSFFKGGLFFNKWLVVGIIASLLLTAGIMYTPMNQFFKLIPLSLIDWGLVLLIGFSITFVYEIGKLFNKRLAL